MFWDTLSVGWFILSTWLFRGIDQYAFAPDSIKAPVCPFLPNPFLSLILHESPWHIAYYNAVLLQFYFSKVVWSTEAFVMENVTVDGKCHFKIFVDCFSNLSGGIKSSAVMKFKRKINPISKQLIKSTNSLRKRAGWSKWLHDAWLSSKDKGSVFPMKTRFLFHQQNLYHLTVSVQRLIKVIQPYYH